MPRQRLVLEPLTRSIIGAFYEVYNNLGYGFLEHVYKAALERELVDRGHRVAREVVIVIHYKGEPIAVQRVDMIVDDKVIVEAKSTMDLQGGAKRQLFSYLHSSNLEVGLLLHFGLEAQFHRVVDLHDIKTPKATEAAEVNVGEELRDDVKSPAAPSSDLPSLPGEPQ